MYSQVSPCPIDGFMKLQDAILAYQHWTHPGDLFAI